MAIADIFAAHAGVSYSRSDRHRFQQPSSRCSSSGEWGFSQFPGTPRGNSDHPLPHCLRTSYASVSPKRTTRIRALLLIINTEHESAKRMTAISYPRLIHFTSSGISLTTLSPQPIGAPRTPLNRDSAYPLLAAPRPGMGIAPAIGRYGAPQHLSRWLR